MTIIPETDLYEPYAVRRAIAALDLLYVRSAREARALLTMWTHRDTLTPADLATVIGHYGRQEVTA